MKKRLVFEMVDGVPYLYTFHTKSHWNACKNDYKSKRVKQKRLDIECDLCTYGENFHIVSKLDEKMEEEEEGG